MTQKARLVVVGNGMAGRGSSRSCSRAADGDALRDRDVRRRALRQLQPHPALGACSPEPSSRDIFLNPLAWYAKNDVRLHAGFRVDAIDPRRPCRTAPSGLPERYDALVLATGAARSSRRSTAEPSALGRSSDGVFVFRTLDDCEAIRPRARAATSAAVIGGGLLGLEAARGLARPRPCGARRPPHAVT